MPDYICDILFRAPRTKITISTQAWQAKLRSVLVSAKICHTVRRTTFTQLTAFRPRLALKASITVASLRFRQPNQKVYVNSGIYDAGKFKGAVLSPGIASS